MTAFDFHLALDGKKASQLNQASQLNLYQKERPKKFPVLSKLSLETVV